MQNDELNVPLGAEAEAEAEAGQGSASSASATRAERIRERMRQAQVIAAQAARLRATGGQPSGAEAARLIAEFHARGGQVTVCPMVDTLQDSTEQNRSKLGKRGTV